MMLFPQKVKPGGFIVAQENCFETLNADLKMLPQAPDRGLGIWDAWEDYIDNCFIIRGLAYGRLYWQWLICGLTYDETTVISPVHGEIMMIIVISQD